MAVVQVQLLREVEQRARGRAAPGLARRIIRLALLPLPLNPELALQQQGAHQRKWRSSRCSCCARSSSVHKAGQPQDWPAALYALRFCLFP